MSSYEYNQLLKFLYFEGYADSYEEAEYILEEMSDEEFEELIEGFKEANLQKMKQQEYKHRNQATSQSGGSRGDARNRASKIASIRGALERGEDPRSDTFGGVRASNPKDHRADFSNNPLNNPPRPVKKAGVQREEAEMQEAWYSGKGTYRTTASGRRVRWDEDEATDTAVSDMMQKRREAAARKAAQQRMKAKGTVPKKGGEEMFESIVEYLFVEGYADTIENAELMAESISENWVNEILEGYVELNRKRQNRMTDQVLRHMKNPNSDWEKIYKIENERDTQTPEVSKAKAEANRRRGEEKRKNQK